MQQDIGYIHGYLTHVLADLRDRDLISIAQLTKFLREHRHSWNCFPWKKCHTNKRQLKKVQLRLWCIFKAQNTISSGKLNSLKDNIRKIEHLLHPYPLGRVFDHEFIWRLKNSRQHIEHELSKKEGE